MKAAPVLLIRLRTVAPKNALIMLRQCLNVHCNQTMVCLLLGPAVTACSPIHDSAPPQSLGEYHPLPFCGMLKNDGEGEPA